MKTRYLLIPVFLLTIFATACGAAPETPDTASLESAQGLAAALQQQGLEVQIGEQISQPFFSVPATLLNTAETGIQVYEYSDASAAQAEADQVAPDGSSVGTSMPFWVGDPHFFNSDKLIVLYLGDDTGILTALESVLGEQFAGR
jgi:hypothetical protein